jgi:hypothetical protein
VLKAATSQSRKTLAESLENRRKKTYKSIENNENIEN